MGILTWLFSRGTSKDSPRQSKDSRGIRLYDERNRPVATLIPVRTQSHSQDQLALPASSNLTEQTKTGVALSGRFVDALAAAIPNAATALKQSQYLQFVPNELHSKVASGAARAIHNRDGLTTLLKDSTSGKFLGQRSLRKVKLTKSLGPLVAWQALHAVAGTMELQQINRKLEVVVSGIHDLQKGDQARDIGQMRSAYAILGDLLAEEQTTGAVSDAMLARLAGVELVIGSQMHRILELVEGIKREIAILQSQEGTGGVKTVAGFLEEKAPEIRRNVEALLTLVASDLKVEELLLRRAMKFSPEDAGRRLKRIQNKVEWYQSTLRQLPSLEDLMKKVESAVADFGWWQRNLLNRDLAKSVDRLKDLQISDVALQRPLQLEKAPIRIVIWEDEVGDRHARAFPIEPDEATTQASEEIKVQGLD